MVTEAFEYIEEVESEEQEEEENKGSEEEENKSIEESSGEEGEENLSPAQELAQSEGWVPEEEWKGNKDEWIDYREFNTRGELMKRIQSQSKQIHPLKDEIAELKTALTSLGEHNKKIAEAEYNRAIKSLKVQKREAREEDDYATLDEIDEQIDELKDAKKELDATEDEKKEKPETKPQGLPPAQKQIVQDWYDKPSNKWYQEEEMLRPIADKLFISRLEQNGGDFSEAFKHMETKMQGKFPNETGGSHKRGGSVTEGSGRSAGRFKGNNKGPKFSKRDLNEEQAAVGKTFVDTGVFENMQEYVDQLVEIGELK